MEAAANLRHHACLMTDPATLTPPRRALISADEALARLLAAIAPTARTETVATPEAWQRVLARDLVSTVDVPPADNSAMDGYAVRIADLGSQAEGEPPLLPVALRIPAGTLPLALPPGAAARIFTGAQVPAVD